MKLKLKDLLIGTGSLLLLTLFQLLRDFIGPSYRGYQEGFKLLLAWLIIAIIWIIYLTGVFRSRRKDQEKEPWNQKEKDPW